MTVYGVSTRKIWRSVVLYRAKRPGVIREKTGAHSQKKKPAPRKGRTSYCLTDTASGGAQRARDQPRTSIIAHMFGIVKPLRQKKRSGEVKARAQISGAPVISTRPGGSLDEPLQ